MIARCPSATASPVGRIALHADDLGMSRAVTEGILRGFRDGPLTSTSLLANAPDAGRALERWKALLGQQRSGELPSGALRRTLDDDDRPFDLGVHLNLTAGRPRRPRYPAELLDDQGQFPGIFSLFQRIARHGGRCSAPRWPRNWPARCSSSSTTACNPRTSTATSTSSCCRRSGGWWGSSGEIPPPRRPRGGGTVAVADGLPSRPRPSAAVFAAAQQFPPGNSAAA